MTENKLSRRSLIKRLVGFLGVYVLSLLKVPAAFARETIGAVQNIKNRIIAHNDRDFVNWCSSMVWYVFKPKRCPDALVQVRNEQDVIDAVQYAKAKKFKISIRSTGHHITGTALQSNGLLIDLSPLDGMEIDQAEKTAWVGPGTRSKDLLSELNKQGLTFPAAHTAVVGLGGFLLGGGLGWNLQQWGVSCHSVMAADIVTADGKTVTATEDKNQDLLWALRGAGPGFFGIVTRLKLKLYPMPRRIVKNTYIFKHDQLSFVTEQLDKFVEVRDERVEILTVLKHSEDVAAVENQGAVFIINFIAFVDSDEEVNDVLQPVEQSVLAKSGILRKERVVTTYSELYAAQSVTDGTSQFRTTSENVWTDNPGGVLRKLSNHFVNTRSKYSFVLAVYGVKGMPKSNTSLPYFADNYVVCTLVGDEEADVNTNFLWMDTAVKIMQPFAKGRYINEVDARRYPEHVRDCFSGRNWQRLTELRRKFDPSGIFFNYPDFS